MRSIRGVVGGVLDYFVDEYQDRMVRVTYLYVLVFLLLIYTFVGYFRETFLHIPVIIRPPHNSTLPSTDIHFDWNKINQRKVAYQIEIDDRSRSFNHIVYEWDNRKRADLRENAALLENHKYYWRVRSIINGVPHTWSRVYVFYTPKVTNYSLPTGDEKFRLSIEASVIENQTITIEGEANLPEGSKLYARLIKRDPERTIKTIAAFVKHGHYVGTFTPDKDKRLSPGRYLIRVDFSMDAQKYPIKKMTGKNGEKLDATGADVGFLVTGLFNETPLVIRVKGKGPRNEKEPLSGRIGAHFEPKQAKMGSFRLGIRGDLTDQKIRIEGETNLPQDAKLYVKLLRANPRSVLKREIVLVKNGEYWVEIARSDVNGLPEGSYFIRVEYLPPIQYVKVKALLGEVGEEIRKRGVEVGDFITALRNETEIEVQ